MPRASSVVVAVFVLVTVWLGSAVWSSYVIEQALTALSARQSLFVLQGTRLEHRAGLFSSTGQLELGLNDRCDSSKVARPKSALMVLDYSIDHLLFPTSLMRFEWALKPYSDKMGASAIGSILSARGAFLGEGNVSLRGAVSTTLTLPEIEGRGGDYTVRVAPSRGLLKIGAESLVFTWDTPHVLVGAAGRAFEAQQWAFEVNLQDRKRGVGSMTSSMARLSTPAGVLQGFRIVAENVAQGERIDSVFKRSIQLASFGDHHVSELVFEVTGLDLHAASIEAIGAFLGDLCNSGDMRTDGRARMLAAVRTLLMEGFSSGVNGFSGAVGNR